MGPAERRLRQRLSRYDPGAQGDGARRPSMGPVAGRILTTHRLTVLAGAVGAAAGFIMGGPGVGLVGAGMGLSAGVRVERNRQAKAALEFGRQLEQAILLLAAALSANQTLSQALRAVGAGIADPVGKLFRAVVEEHSAGRSLPECLATAAEKASHRDFTYLVQALEVQRYTGGDLMGVLGHTAAAVRDRRLLRGEMEAKVAEAKLTADVLTLSTLGLAAYFVVFHPEALRPLYETLAGRAAVVYAAVSWMTGAWIMGRLLKLQDLEDAG